jgi:plasmid stability protein
MEKPESHRPLHVLIPADLHQRVKVMAAENDRSVAAETRRALEAACDRHDDRLKAAA